MKPVECYDSSCSTIVDKSSYSAYCGEHQYKPPEWRATLTGRKMCQCARCHEVFTTSRLFDSHIRFREGKLICKDPRTMRDKNHRRLMVLTTRCNGRAWGKNPDIEGFDTFNRKERS